jgi:hypothetical protein
LLDTFDRTINPTLLGSSEGDCSTDKPDVKKIYIDAVIPGPGGMPLGAPFDVEIAGAVSDPRIVGSVPRCYGGTISVGATTHPWSGASTITATPTCKQCDGTALIGGSGPPQVCADEYDLAADIDDGPGGSTRTHLFELHKTGPTSWHGVSQYGANATITSRTSQPAVLHPGDAHNYQCCPAMGWVITRCDDPDDPRCIAEDGIGCIACWNLEILASGFTAAEFFGIGSCPPAAGNGQTWSRYDTSPMTISLDSYGFVEGTCPTAP